MTQYDNTNRGALWINDRKQSDKHPDLSGSINIDGKDYWISGWTKKPGSNPRAPEVSVSVRPVEEKQVNAQRAEQPDPAADINADISW